MLTRLERVATIYQRQYQGDLSSWLPCLSLSPHASRGTTQLPCYVLPPIQTIRFFDRDDVIRRSIVTSEIVIQLRRCARWHSIAWEEFGKATSP